MMIRRLVRPLLLLLFLCVAVAWAADYVMKQGDTLSEIAKQHYGNASYWTALKWYNGVGNVYTIPVGTPINFPDKATLDSVNQILKNNATPAARSAAIAQLGGGTNPVPSPNPGLGKPINYGAITALARPTLPTR